MIIMKKQYIQPALQAIKMQQVLLAPASGKSVPVDPDKSADPGDQLSRIFDGDDW